jgi:hypothetical protein
MQGPPGANLFVFRIPDDFTDESMKDTFAPFGNLLDPLVLRVRDMITLTNLQYNEFVLLGLKPVNIKLHGDLFMVGLTYHPSPAQSAPSGPSHESMKRTVSTHEF